ncbi:hypothetical protein ACFPYJ_19710 [Paenibacillus solisilvae]|uniref:Uncharacterized protein n=1 Tax=Paenibacillus solisilvae TaxID=2486751 RepID=A0ABW0W2M6_9BACL
MAAHQTGTEGRQTALLNPIPKQSEGPYLQTTLSLKPIDGTKVAFQNGIPVPSFEPRQRTKILL